MARRCLAAIYGARSVVPLAAIYGASSFAPLARNVPDANSV